MRSRRVDRHFQPSFAHGVRQRVILARRPIGNTALRTQRSRGDVDAAALIQLAISPGGKRLRAIVHVHHDRVKARFGTTQLIRDIDVT